MPEPQVIFELTNLCQLDCIHCLVADRDRTLSLPVDLYEDILGQVAKYGIHRVYFTGGEPTLHPRFAEVLDITSCRGFSFCLVSNGWNFSHTLPVLLKHRQALEWVAFSLDGAKEETHDYMRKPGSYRRVLDALDLCVKEKIPPYLQMVLTTRNYTEVEELCNLALEKGVTGLKLTECGPTYRSAQHGLDLSLEQYVEIGKQVAQLQPKYRPKLLVYMTQAAHPPIPWTGCELLKMELFSITAEGYLVLCTNLAGYAGSPRGAEVVADLKEVSFHEGHRRLIRLIGQVYQDKVDAIEKGTVSVRECTFPCWYCARYFKKTGWLKEFPDNPWNDKTEPVKADLSISSQV